MPLHKTMKGQEALLKRDKSLSILERQVLLLADGKTPRTRWIEMLGDAGVIAMASLLERGYISDKKEKVDFAISDFGLVQRNEKNRKFNNNQWAATSPQFLESDFARNPGSYEDFQDTVA